MPDLMDPASPPDLLQPFLIDARSIRGRMVRMGPAIDAVLSGHDYPMAVAHRLAEALTLAVALAGTLKFDGVFTLQIQADGAIPMLVADITSGGDLRGYARFDPAKLALAEQSDQGTPVERFLGKGFLAFTVDQGADTERYQGIVELGGASLADCARIYFEQSEQLETDFKLASKPPQDGAGWQTALLMLQRMPLGPNSPILTADEAEETWNRATILQASATDAEMLDPGLSAAALLHRLYHADYLELPDARPVRARCRCSAERVETTLRSFPRQEVEGFPRRTGRWWSLANTANRPIVLVRATWTGFIGRILPHSHKGSAMSIQKKRLLFVTLGWLGLLAACSSPPPPSQKLPPMSFTQAAPMPLDVARIEYKVEYSAPAVAPHIEYDMPVSPENALRRWVSDRLRPVGKTGVLRVVIRNASATENAAGHRSGLHRHVQEGTGGAGGSQSRDRAADARRPAVRAGRGDRQVVAQQHRARGSETEPARPTAL